MVFSWRGVSLDGETEGDGPCGVGVFVKGAAAAFGPDDQPAAIWSLGTEDREEVFPEAGRGPVVARVGFADLEVHFFRKGAVEEVEGAFVLVVVHVFDVGLERPVDCFSAEFDVAIFAE